MCGASVSTENTQCDHCGARLATVACPSCFGMIFVGAKFCSHCGAKYERVEGSGAALDCPRCKAEMKVVTVGKVELRECPRCQGIWAETEAVERICADRDQEVSQLGKASPITPGTMRLEKEIRYLPCPVCAKLMNRVNFARCSTVVVDVCKSHGTWFDLDELRGIVEFVRAGGLDLARAREVEEMEERRRRLQADNVANPLSSSPGESLELPLFGEGFSAAAAALKRLLK
jgi:Zn-finger nucleic acid-binding protein